MRKLKAFAIRILQSLGIGAEYPDRDIILEISHVDRSCPRGLTEGQSFLFNIWDRKELCPASFYALYPLLLQQMTASPPVTQCENSFVHCPDPFGVLYKCTAESIGWNCEDFFSSTIEVVEERGTCPHGHCAGDSFTFEESLPTGFCPLAFYALFPYYQTLIHSGRFEWVRSNEQVQVQCPKADGVVMEIERIRQSSLGDGAVRATIVDKRGSCPKGLNQGDTFEFDSHKQPLCFHAMVGLIPFMNNRAERQYYRCCGVGNHLLLKVK
jgi:uncharacterized repeat protein (TIGR04076 family)